MSIDYVRYLKGFRMIGQIDPWRADDNGKPIFALLVTVDVALAECIALSGQDMTRHEFLSYLKEQDVQVFKNVDEFANLKEGKVREVKAKKNFKRKVSEETREKLRNRMKSINSKKIPSISKNPQ